MKKKERKSRSYNFTCHCERRQPRGNLAIPRNLTRLLRVARNDGQTGRSMIEMLGILAIIGVLSVSTIIMFRTLMVKHEANQILNDIRLADFEIRNKESLPTGLNDLKTHFESGYHMQGFRSSAQINYIVVSDIDEKICQELKKKEGQYLAIYNSIDGVLSEPFEVCSDKNNMTFSVGENLCFNKCSEEQTCIEGECKSPCGTDGSLFYDNNGTKYCISNYQMYGSGVGSWCAKLNMHKLDITTLCNMGDLTAYVKGNCPQFVVGSDYQTNMDYFYAFNETDSFIISMITGNIFSPWAGGFRAMCRF